MKGRIPKNKAIGLTFILAKLNCVVPNELHLFLKVICAQTVHGGISHCFEHA